MFKKIISLLLVLNLLFNNVVFAEQIKLTIHYKKSDAYYENVTINIKYDDKVGTQNFIHRDEFGGVLDARVPFNQEVQIEVYDDKILIDEFIVNMHINNEVWKEENNNKVNYAVPSMYSSKTETESTKNIEVYYKRYDNNYKNKQLLITNNGKEESYNFIDNTNYAYANVEINDETLNYFNVVEDDDVIDFEKGVIYSNSLEDNKIYLLQDKEVAFYNNEIYNNEKKIQSAYIDENNNIFVKLYTKVELEESLYEGFSISKLNGDTVHINYVEPLDVVEDKYCDSFKIGVSSLPIQSKCVVSKVGYEEMYLSKKLLYDTETYNDLLKHAQNLGVRVSGELIKFNLFYPNAEDAQINIIENNEIVKTYNFDKIENDIWKFETDDDLVGKSYNYKVVLNGDEYFIEEPFSKIINENGHSVIYNTDSYEPNKKINLENKEYMAIYTYDIEDYITFKEENESMEVSSSLVKSYLEYENAEKSRYEEIEKKEDESIKNVAIKYFLYEEGILDKEQKEVQIEHLEEDEVVPVFKTADTLYDKEILEIKPASENFEIEKINENKLATDVDYSHFYFNYGEDFEIIRLDNNVNNIKQLINSVHDKNKKVIFNYNIDLNKIQYLCDEYYYSDGYINTNRIITQKSIFEDVQFLIDLYNIDGLTFDLTYYDEQFLEKLQNKFTEIKIIGVNGEKNNKQKFYNLYEFDLDYLNFNEDKNIYKINNVDNMQFELFMILLNGAIPFFNSIEIDNPNKINEIFHNKNFLINKIENEIEVLQEDEHYGLYKLKSDSDQFDYYMIAINKSENDYMVTLPSINNKIVIDNEGFHENKEYINKNLMINAKSVYVLKTSSNNIKYTLNYKKIIRYIEIFLIFVLLFLLFKKRRKRKKKMFI